MLCNVKLQKLLSAHKSHVRDTSLFTGAIPNPVRNSQTSRFVSRSKAGKVKPRRQHGATVAVGDDGGRVAVVQEWNRCNRPEYTPAGIYPGLKRPRLDYTRVYYGLGQFIPRGILWPRPIHTSSGQNIPS